MGLPEYMKRPLDKYRPSLVARSFARKVIAEEAEKMGGTAELMSLIPRINDLEGFTEINSHNSVDGLIKRYGFSKAGQLTEVIRTTMLDFTSNFKDNSIIIASELNGIADGFGLMATDARNFGRRFYDATRGGDLVSAYKHLKNYFRGGGSGSFHYYGLAPVIESGKINMSQVTDAFVSIRDSVSRLRDDILTIPSQPW